jgi:hypothetical protein
MNIDIIDVFFVLNLKFSKPYALLKMHLVRFRRGCLMVGIVGISISGKIG